MPHEIKKLGQVLNAHEKQHKRQVALIRLLLLTGCRKGKFLNLQWSFYRDGHLHLPDSKTGPKIIYLSTPARQILDSLPRGRSKWVFPGHKHGKPLLEVSLWRCLRKQAGLEHVRLHDLRHSFANHAVMRGVPLPMVSRLLGYSRLSMTMRYAHFSDELVEASAETVESILAGYLDAI